MAISFVKVWFDFEDRTEMLNEVEKGRLLLAMLRYAQGKELPELKGGERFLFPVFKMDIDRDANTYNAKINNGAKGGRPKKETEQNLTKPNETEPNQEFKNKELKNKEQNNKEQGNGISARTRFIPPTPDQVRAYATEKGLEVDAERFCDYYASKGWKVGQTPMKDWQAAARNWSKRGSWNNNTQTVNPALDFKQRTYTEDELNGLILDMG